MKISFIPVNLSQLHPDRVAPVNLAQSGRVLTTLFSPCHPSTSRAKRKKKAMDAIREKHHTLISGLTKLYDLLVLMRYIPTSCRKPHPSKDSRPGAGRT